MPGFIKTNKDIKLLVLYALSKFDVPLSFEELSLLTLVDEGINYFLLKQSVDELLIPENIVLENNCYSLTKRGKDNLESSLSDIPHSLQQRCHQASIEVKKAQDKKKYIRSSVSDRGDGTALVHLTLLNKTGVLFEMQMMVPDMAEAQKISSSFQKDSTTYFYAMRDIAQRLTLPPGEKQETKSHVIES